MILQITKTPEQITKRADQIPKTSAQNSRAMQNSERVILQITKRPSRLQNGADYIPRSSGVPQREFCRGFCNVQDYKKPLRRLQSTLKSSHADYKKQKADAKMPL